MKTKPLFVALAILATATQSHAADAAIAEAARVESAQRVEYDKKAEYERQQAAEKEKAAYEAMTDSERAEYDKKAEYEKAQAAEAEQGQIKKPEISGKVSEVQSPARPFDLDIVSPVQVAATDKASEIFQKEGLPSLIKVADTRLTETEAAKALDAVRIDPNKLTLAYDTTVRVYFVGEGAGYHNTLGFSTTGGTTDAKDAALIFPDASSNLGLNGSGEAIRDEKNPLLAGDFVDLGTFKAGTKLDFFLIADGVGYGKDVYSTVDGLNPDGLFHAVSLAPEGSTYLLLSFEDLFGGGDKDYNDVVFAVEIGKANIKNLAEVAKLNAPEPTLAIGAALSCGVLLLGRRRRTAH